MPDTPAYDKAELAWTLPWQDDWVTAGDVPRRRTPSWPRATAAAKSASGTCRKRRAAMCPAAGAAAWTATRNEITRLLATPGRQDADLGQLRPHDPLSGTWRRRRPAAPGDPRRARRAPRQAQEAARRPPPPAPGVKVETQQAERVLEGHKEWVLGLSLSRDGDTLLSGDDAGRSMRLGSAGSQGGSPLEDQGLGVWHGRFRPMPAHGCSERASRWSYASRITIAASSSGTWPRPGEAPT